MLTTTLNAWKRRLRRRKAFIHVGTVKTGTTYLQKTFWQNAEILKSFGIAYPFVTPRPLPLRYTNAHFMADRAHDDRARKIIGGAELPLTLISEENLFFHIGRLNHPAFESVPTTIIVYVRKPAEVIAAWAAESAAPYNAFMDVHTSGVGPLAVDVGIEYLADWYERAARDFMAFIESNPQHRCIVRPFERASLRDGDLLADFLHCLGVDAKRVRAHPDFRDPGIINESQSRKFCDVSAGAWALLGKPRKPRPYDVHLVREIVAACQSGDGRHVVETLTDDVVERLTARFAFFEEFLSRRLLKGAPLFQNGYPASFGLARAPYHAVDPRELERLTAQAVQRREAVPV